MNTLTYEVVPGWEQLPQGYQHRDVAGVAVDGEDRIFLICRGDHPIIVYDCKGNFLRSWGEGDFTYRTHGITVAPDGIAIDSKRDVYISEVTWTFSVSRGYAPPGTHTFQKFALRAG